MTGTQNASIELTAIGKIRTGFDTLDKCPSSGRFNPAESLIEVRTEFAEGLLNIELASHIMILYWFDKADRTSLSRGTASNSVSRGVFASRSPNRPNPIAVSIVKLLGVQNDCLRVSGLDCLDGTLVLDIKPYIPADDRIDNAQIGWDYPAIAPDVSFEGTTAPPNARACQCKPAQAR